MSGEGTREEALLRGTGYGPDFLDAVQITVKNWKAAGIDAQIVYDIQRHAAEQAYFGPNGSSKVVSAWEPYIK